MSLDQIVDLQIEIESSGISTPGFGTPVILTRNEDIDLDPNEIQFFSSAAELLPLFADSDTMVASQEYKDALAIMSQRPRPLQFAVAMRTDPTQAHVFTGTVTNAGAENDTITLVITDQAGEEHTAQATVPGSPTTTNVATAIRTALATIDQDVGTAGVTIGGAGAVFTITGATVGEAFTIDKVTVGTVAVNLVNTTDTFSAILTDLPITAAANVYAFLIPERDEASIMTVAAAVEADGKHIFYAQSNDADILTSTYDDDTPGDDVGSRLKALNYDRTALFYHPTDSEPLAAAFAGAFLPNVPGSTSGKFRQLVGVLPVSFNTTQLNNLISKSVNSYRVEAGRGMTFEGTVASGEYIDVIHGIDKLYSRVQALVFLAMSRANKIPFTDGGLATLGGAVVSALMESVRDQFIAESRVLPDGSIQSPAFSVTVPRAVDIPADDRAARRIPSTNPIRFEATLAGAVHSVSIRGTVSV